MLPSNSATSAVTPKNVIGVSVLFLILAAIFGLFNSHKVKMLRTNAANAAAIRDMAEHRRATQGRNLETRETTAGEGEAKNAEAENKAAKAEAELAQSQKEKSDLQSKVGASQNEIASLQKRIEEAEKMAKPAANPAAASTPELQAQLDDARHQLDSAEKEKAFLSEKLQTPLERSTQPQEEKKRRESGARKPGVRGNVLSEMLVLREGTLIGKIRISSVEPATAIGDIITSSLARGVQVQPGDIVVYAGTNS